MTEFVAFRVTGITGGRAVGGYLIRFSMQADIASLPRVKQIRFSDPYAKISIGPHFTFVAIARSDSPQQYEANDTAYERTLTFDMALSKEQLEGLERHRNGKDMQLTMDIYGNLFDGYNWNFGYDRINPVTIDRGAWTKALEETGYGSSLVFELPLKHASLGDVQAMDAALTKAREHLYDGNYREVVADCRVAMEWSP